MTLTPLFAYDSFELSVRVGRDKGQGETIAAGFGSKESRMRLHRY